MEALTHNLEMIATVVKSLSEILGFCLMFRECIRWYGEVRRPGVPPPEDRTDRR